MNTRGRSQGTVQENRTDSGAKGDREVRHSQAHEH